MESGKRPYRRHYEFKTLPFGSTEALASYAEWLVALLGEVGGTTARSSVTVRKGTALYEADIPLAEFRERVDEFPLDGFADFLRVEIGDPDGSLEVTFEHRGVVGIPGTDRVEIVGSDKSRVMAIIERVRRDGDERAAEEPVAPKRRWRSRLQRARKKLREGVVPGLKSIGGIVSGVIILVLAAVILAYVFHLPLP